jgi:3',5'-cyclic AMP phosphodiesterase CpdA
MHKRRRLIIGLCIPLAAGALAAGAWAWFWSGGPAIIERTRTADLAGVDPGFGSSTFKPFVFLHFGDPQIGMRGVTQVSERFAEAVSQANALRPAFVVIAGDLTETGAWDERADFWWTLRGLRAPVALVPGNHDLAYDASRAAYLRAYGPEYYTFVYRNCAFICLNSELARGGRFEREGAEQQRFLAQSLAEAKAAGRNHVFIIQHEPPFRSNVGSRTASVSAARRSIVTLAREYGVAAFLCGHLHTTQEFRLPDGPPAVYVAGGTAPTDVEGPAFRLFRVFADRYEQSIVGLNAPGGGAAVAVP